MKLKNVIGPMVFYLAVAFVAGVTLVFLGIKMFTGEEGNTAIPFILLFLGLLIIFVSMLSIRSTLKKVKVTDDLKRTGYKCPGVIIEIVPDYSMSIEGNHPLIARCHVMDSITGEIMVLKSDPYFNNLSKLMYKEVDVYIDDLEKGRYFIDMEKLMRENPTLVCEIASYDYTPD